MFIDSANRLIEEYKEKCIRLEELLKSKTDEYKSNLQKTKEDYENQINTLNNIIEEGKKELCNMQNELKEKNEEILRLTSINDELLKDCKLDITFEIFAEELATDITELERLQKENQEMKSKLNDYDETTKEIQSKINALEKEKSNLNKNHEDELKNKNDRIKGLENEINNKVNEINSKANDIKKLKETEKKLKKEISEFDSKMQSKQSVMQTQKALTQCLALKCKVNTILMKI